MLGAKRDLGRALTLKKKMTYAHLKVLNSGLSHISRQVSDTKLNHLFGHLVHEYAFSSGGAVVERVLRLP